MGVLVYGSSSPHVVKIGFSVVYNIVLGPRDQNSEGGTAFTMLQKSLESASI
jgi:hypothetical protein